MQYGIDKMSPDWETTLKIRELTHRQFSKVMERKRLFQRTHRKFSRICCNLETHIKTAGLRERLEEKTWHARNERQGRESWFQIHLF